MAETTIKLPSSIVVRDFAAKLGLPITTITSELIRNGVMASLNQEIDFATAAIIAEDLGKKVELEGEEQAPVETVNDVDQYLVEDPGAKLVARPPVVVVMGHVDHGKTSLLDAIRSTTVTSGEAGGITQKIGAYQITKQDRLITFIDTPGHEAFSQMRTRGARIADVAILVVASDDGIKPQTKEARRMIDEAKLPYIVAITKSDKPEANPERVKKELAEENILAEDYGGKIPVIPVSSKTKEGIENILEAVLLLADVDATKLMVNADRPAIGTIIESHVDPKQGPVASVLIQTGTLKVGDEIVVGQVFGKIRSLKNDRGETIKQAPPSLPVQILGLKAAPQVGDVLRVDAGELKKLKKTVKSHQLTSHIRTVVGTTGNASNQTEEERKKIQKLFVIIKTDTLGSAEAVLGSLKKLPNQEVSVEIVQRGLGIISEADVLRAEAAKSIIYGFNVQVSPKADQLARSKNITILPFNVIYSLIDDVTERLENMLAPLAEVQEIGRLKVLGVFRNENTFQVFGGKVTDGELRMSASIEVLRGTTSIGKGTITQLQQNKQNVKEVSAGNEAGMKVDGITSAAVGDTAIVTVTTYTKRKLLPNA